MSINRTQVRSVVHVHELLSIAFGRRKASEWEQTLILKQRSMQASRNWRRCLKVARLARLACPRLISSASEAVARCSVLPGYGIAALTELDEASLMKAPYNIDCHIHYRVVPGVVPYVARRLLSARHLRFGDVADTRRSAPPCTPRLGRGTLCVRAAPVRCSDHRHHFPLRSLSLSSGTGGRSST